MDFQERLRNYAKLVVKSGCNLQKGQELLLQTPIQCAEFARLIVEEAYQAGAKEVTVMWGDEKVARMRYDYCGMEVFENVPEWRSALYNGLAKHKGAVLTIAAEDPEAMAGVDPRKISAWTKAADVAFKPYYDAIDMGKNTWCIVSAPTPAWAKKVFPGCAEKEAIEKLWDAIFKAVRADQPDPAAAWEQHRKSFEERSRFLTEQQFDRLHYKNSIGTDIVIGLLKNHVWAGGGERTADGVYFFPNMPTEEIFSTPDRERADGTVHSAMPLNYQGTLIDDFSITFENGRAVSCTAAQGYENLKQIIEIDDGAHRLGEIALIPKKSPISEMGILFYNTLFDENAACHFALGKGFAECVQGGREMEEKELLAAGVNQSAVHVDFMLGTNDLEVTGIKADGTEIAIFQNGNWAF